MLYSTNARALLITWNEQKIIKPIKHNVWKFQKKTRTKNIPGLNATDKIRCMKNRVTIRWGDKEYQWCCLFRNCGRAKMYFLKLLKSTMMEIHHAAIPPSITQQMFFFSWTGARSSPIPVSPGSQKSIELTPPNSRDWYSKIKTNVLQEWSKNLIYK